MGHFADPPLAASRQAQRQKRDTNLLLACHRVADRLGELGLARAHVSGKHNEGRPAEHRVEQGLRRRVDAVAPNPEGERD